MLAASMLCGSFLKHLSKWQEIVTSQMAVSEELCPIHFSDKPASRPVISFGIRFHTSDSLFTVSRATCGFSPNSVSPDCDVFQIPTFFC
jgi:hypothetical protein